MCGLENVCNSSNRASSAFSGRWPLSVGLMPSPPTTTDPKRAPEGGCEINYTLTFAILRFLYTIIFVACFFLTETFRFAY